MFTGLIKNNHFNTHFIYHHFFQFTQLQQSHHQTQKLSQFTHCNSDKHLFLALTAISNICFSSILKALSVNFKLLLHSTTKYIAHKLNNSSFREYQQVLVKISFIINDHFLQNIKH